MADENVSFNQGGDSGDNTVVSIQPCGYTGVGEFNDDTVFNRVFDNLRRRTEILRRELEATKYLLDYDRGLILWSGGTFQLTQHGSGPYTYSLVSTQDLFLQPALSPGYQSGGRNRGAMLFIGDQPYAGTALTNDLIIVASAAYTGQRAYADGESLDDAGVVSVGANAITVELVAEARTGGVNTVQATVTGSPRRHIRITYGTLAGGTTLATLIAAINGDVNLFGTDGDFGLSNLIHASTTSSGASTSIPTFGPTLLRGGYDAEGHKVTVANFASFFGTSENQLKDGESLALGFRAGLVEPGTEVLTMGSWQYLGGRRQSLYDAPTDRVGGSTENLGSSAAAGNLFNTGRQPELIPLAIPLGKMEGDQFVFVDGTRLTAGGPAIQLGESFVTVARITAAIVALLADFASTGGASLIGYNGSAAWNTSTTDDPDAYTLPVGTVEAAIDAVVTQLSRVTAGSSGARRIGAEAVTSSPAAGNRQVNLPGTSMRAQILALLTGADTNGNLAGLIHRVSELGHRTRGANPIYKDFAAGDMPAQGSQFLQAVLPAPTNLLVAPGTQKMNTSLLNLVPLVWDDSAIGGDMDDVLAETEVISASGLISSSVVMSGMTPTRYARLIRRLPIPTSPDTGTQVGPVVVVKLVATAGAADAGDGLYYLIGFNGGDKALILRRFADMSVPDFTGMGSGGITFYGTVILGSDKNGTRLKLFDWNPNRPIVVVGMGDKSSPMLDVFVSEGGAGNVLAARYRGNNVWWFDTRRINGGAATRSTNNILTTVDKTVLDGGETGTPVDGSTSHHHAAMYSKTVFRSAAHNYTAVSNMSTGAPWFFETLSDQPAGYSKTAVIINVSCQVAVAGGAGSTDLIGLVLEFAGSSGLATFNAGTMGMTMTKAAVGSTVMFITGQITVPIYFDSLINFPIGASGFRVRIQGGSTGAGVDLTLSTLQIDEVGYIQTKV